MTKEERKKIKRENSIKMYNYDKNLSDYVLGIDEAGRGPLAGPVVVAACIIDWCEEIAEIDDSKKISEKKRYELYNLIKEKARFYSISMIDNNVIDSINILNATKKGMYECIENIDKQINIFNEEKALNFNYQTIITDYVEIKTDKILHCISKADSTSFSVACASILAKVTRDEFMKNLNGYYLNYEFDKHKGYGTKQHYELLKKYGISDIHRKSFLKIKSD